jgi:hypothetical protein
VQGLQAVHRVRVQQHGGQHAWVELHLRHGTGRRGDTKEERMSRIGTTRHALVLYCASFSPQHRVT